MNRIIRLWNQNRKQFIIIGLIVVFSIILIQVLNQIAKQKNENRTNTISNTIQTEEKLPTESIIGKSSVSEKTTKENTNAIDEFINNCNNGKIEEAYNMLTDKCKELLFPTQELFVENYYKIIFAEKRIYNIQNWVSASKTNTYLVDYFGDAMSTGKVDEAIAFQDYITVENNSNGKISINGFINYKEIGKSSENDKIKITVVSKEIYKGYEQYEVKVQNKTDGTILLDTRKKSGTIAINNGESIDYKANLNEVSNRELLINANQEITYKFRFDKSYVPSKITEKITFKDIVENYELYAQDKENYKDRMQITIKM